MEELDQASIIRLDQAALRLQVLKDHYQHGITQLRNQYLKPLAATGPAGVTAANAFLWELAVDVDATEFEAAEQPEATEIAEVHEDPAAPFVKAKRPKRSKKK